MTMRSMRIGAAAGILAAGVALVIGVRAQDNPPAAPADLPPVPKGVEVLARGPVHEAFATPTTEPMPTTPVSKKPPKPIDELPPEEKPEGNVIWIGGYYHWDDERKDFLWVSGVWRTAPPGRQWVAGYWREDGDQAVWVPGFWAEAPKQEAPAQEVTYLPTPPEPPKLAGPGQPPSAEHFYVPGYWVWRADVGKYAWRDGFWTKIQPGYVWVSSHYRWSPSGYIFVPGYWDIVVANRGVMYAPVYIDTNVVGATYVYTPAYVVPETVVVSAMFIRPSCCHYYYGDYYEVRYRDCGYTSCVVYSQSHYDSIVVYETYAHREEPTWISLQIDLCSRREREPALRPVSTSITNANYNTYVVNNVTNVTNVNNTTINNTTNNNTTNNKSVANNNFLMPAKQLAAAKGVKTVPLDQTTRAQAKQQAQAVQQVAVKRGQEEVPAAGGAPKTPVTKSVPVANTQPVGPRPATTGTATGTAVKGTSPDNAVRTTTGTGTTAHPATTSPGVTAPTRTTTGTITGASTPQTGTGSTTGTTPRAGPGNIGGTMTTPAGTAPPRAGTGTTGGTTTTPNGTQPPRSGPNGTTGNGNSIVPAGGRAPAPPPTKPAPPSKDKDKDKDKDKKPNG
ncbi:MAG TPA: hypothetical protein VGG61_06735 [Gemmataceae bacterium]